MSQKPLIFKVVTGYKPTDYVLINNTADLEKAIYARIERIPVTLGGKFISGTEIKSIEPDVHSYTGWHRSYEAGNADDFAQIERDVPAIASEVLTACTQRVMELLKADNMEQIGQIEVPVQELLGN